MKKIKIFPWIANSFVILLSVFFIAIVVHGATTIGNNINTDGNLTVSGNASTTSATTTDYLYVGPDATEPAGWDFRLGDLFVTDDAFFNSQATTSASLWVGSGGTANNINLAGGDLFVQGDAEFDGVFFFARATGTSATTTDYLYVGPDATEPAGWDFSLGDLFVTDDAFFNSQATTSASFWVGSGGTANNIDVAGGDLYVQNYAEIDGSLYTGNTLITGRATTTANFVAGGSNTSATTTITLGSNTGAAGAGVCFRIRQDAGWKFCYVSGTAFTCGATICE